MHPEAKRALIGHLQAMVNHGTFLSMLIMTVKTTSNGMIAGVVDGQLRLDYVWSGWFDLLRLRRFKAFCALNGLSMYKERWDKELAYRASIGTNPDAAAELIDQCFGHVFGNTGPFGMDFRHFGWHPSE